MKINIKGNGDWKGEGNRKKCSINIRINQTNVLLLLLVIIIAVLFLCFSEILLIFSS